VVFRGIMAREFALTYRRRWVVVQI